MANNNDLKDVVDTASFLHVSEFEVFQLAYQNWFGRSAEQHELNASFSHYMNKAVAPMWVRAFTRRVRELNDEGRLDVREFGLEPLPDTTYWTAFLGGMAFAFIVMIVALLIYLVIRTEDTAMMGCQFPPCY